MAGRKSKTLSAIRPSLQTITPATRYPDNPDHLCNSNPLIETEVADTLRNCASVVAFLAEHHSRRPAESTEQAEDGESFILAIIQDALTKQAEELSATKEE